MQKLKKFNVTTACKSHSVGPILILQLDFFGVDFYEFSFTKRDVFLANFQIIKQNAFNLLQTLHKAQILHNDVKLDNFLIDEETMEMKIIDFG